MQQIKLTITRRARGWEYKRRKNIKRHYRIYICDGEHRQWVSQEIFCSSLGIEWRRFLFPWQQARVGVYDVTEQVIQEMRDV